jgi:expansin (peptidoglycan-binding protein)
MLMNKHLSCQRITKVFIYNFVFLRLSKTEYNQFIITRLGSGRVFIFELFVKIIHIRKVRCEIRKLQRQNLF